MATERKHVVTLHLSEAEKAALEQIAEADGLTKAAALRHAIKVVLRQQEADAVRCAEVAS